VTYRHLYRCGSVVAITGIAGAGKSTLLNKLLTKALEGDSRRVPVFGRAIDIQHRTLMASPPSSKKSFECLAETADRIRVDQKNRSDWAHVISFPQATLLSNAGPRQPVGSISRLGTSPIKTNARVSARGVWRPQHFLFAIGRRLGLKTRQEK
jgi:hypothetical protein